MFSAIALRVLVSISPRPVSTVSHQSARRTKQRAPRQAPGVAPAPAPCSLACSELSPAEDSGPSPASTLRRARRGRRLLPTRQICRSGFAVAQCDQSLFEPRAPVRLDVDLAATGETDGHIVKKNRLKPMGAILKLASSTTSKPKFGGSAPSGREQSQRGVAGVELQRGEIDGALVWRDPHSAPALDLQPFKDRDIS